MRRDACININAKQDSLKVPIVNLSNELKNIILNFAVETKESIQNRIR